VSGGATSTTVHVPLDTVHTFNTVNKEAVHNGAMPPPLHATLMDAVGATLIDMLGAVDNDVDLDGVVGAMGNDLVFAILNAAGIDKDTARSLPLSGSSTCGSMMPDVISPSAAAIAQVDAQLDDLLESDSPSTVVSAPTAQDQNPNLNPLLT
jgi:hypothetical protein